MSTGLNVNNPTIVSAFYNELLRQGLVVALIVLLVGAAWSISRSAQLRRAATGPAGRGGRTACRPGGSASQAAAPRLVRDALDIRRHPPGPGLDAPRDGASGDPTGCRHLARLGPASRQRHGDDLELSPRRGAGGGRLDPGRARGVAAGRFQGHVVAPSEALPASPGARSSGCSARPSARFSLRGRAGCSASRARCCCTASPERSSHLPETAWRTARLGRSILAAIGAFWVGMALLQAWPGRGFWQGHVAGHATRRHLG